MNIIELNQIEVSSVSGGSSIIVTFNIAGFVVGCIYAACKLHCGSYVTTYTPESVLQQYSNSALMIPCAETEWVYTGLITKTLVIMGFMLGGNIIFSALSERLFGESK